MTPTERLQIELAAAREAAFTAAIVNATPGFVSLTAKIPELMPIVKKELEDLAKQNSWDSHLEKIQKLLAKFE